MISWDSHIIEPRDLFAQVKDGPRIVETTEVGCVWRTPGIPDYPLALTILGRPGRYEDLDPAGYDPDDRLKYQRDNGITSEVLFPTFGLHLRANGRFDLLGTVYAWMLREWSGETFDVETSSLWRVYHSLETPNDYAHIENAGSVAGGMLAVGRAAQDLLATEVFSGKDHRGRYLIAEAGVGWLPDWCARADRIYTHHRHWAKLPELPALPSELVKRHFAFTYTYETPPEGFDCRWASDFPHFDGVARRPPA